MTEIGVNLANRSIIATPFSRHVYCDRSYVDIRLLCSCAIMTPGVLNRNRCLSAKYRAAKVKVNNNLEIVSSHAILSSTQQTDCDP